MPLQNTKILYVPTMEFIVPTISHLDTGAIRIELYDKATKTFMGVLYYEKAKNGFSRKPVGLNKMACVDAKIQFLVMSKINRTFEGRLWEGCV